jgi:uracil-DNA glycosylase
MGWTERQQRMLRAMGLRVWAPVSPAQQAEAHENVAHENVAYEREAVERVERAVLPVLRNGAASSPAVVSAATPPNALAGEREVDIAGMDWPALREAVATCRACALCEGRKNTVFGVGNPQAHWMIVGEAPGENEDLQGEPFVGQAGQLLDAMLRALSLSRQAAAPASQVFIANTLKCRPPRNRNPLPQELASCEAFLKRQIALVQPRIILAMGKFAIQQLLRSDEPVGHLRGRVHQYQGVPLVVTYHPAYLLRQPSEKAKAWEDLRLAVSAVEAAVAAP